MYEKIIVVTRKTRLQELIAKFNTKGQAKFYLEHSGGDFADYQKEDDNYQRAREVIQSQLSGTKVQFVEREFLPNFIFTEKDIVVALGQDGLVANVAKYVGAQPIIGVNPDTERFDGILVPIRPTQVRAAVTLLTLARAKLKTACLAEAVLNDGQRLLAFNDLFIGAQTHVSARYKIEYSGKTEVQSSSGLIVSTGAGSTGWLSSIFNMVYSIEEFANSEPKVDEFTGRLIAPGRVSHRPTDYSPMRRNWGTEELTFVVREPFKSKHSSADIVIGKLNSKRELVIESRMPSGGTIFSDGIENDFLRFDSGMVARIRTADQKVALFVP